MSTGLFQLLAVRSSEEGKFFQYFYPFKQVQVSVAHTCCVTRTILVYSGIFTFLIDAYPTYAASALAANSFTRSTFGGVFPLFGTQSKSSLPFRHWNLDVMRCLDEVSIVFDRQLLTWMGCSVQ